MALAAKVGNPQTDLPDQFVSVAVARAHRGLPGRLLFYVKRKIDQTLAFNRAVFRLDLHIFKVVQHVNPALAFLHHILLIYVAGAQLDFASDNLFSRLSVAGDIDPANSPRLPLKNL